MGGMAEIFRGTATAGGGFEKPVAIKRILPHLCKDQRFIELLIAEAKVLSELQHRNIVQIYDVGVDDDGQYFLVMEFIDGMDLKKVYQQLFNGRRLPTPVALHICSELCEALEHAHLAKDAEGKPLGLVHRDVSPSNVLLSRSGEVKLTDFGIAKRVDEATGHGKVKGKFAYISPEQAVNEHVDARSDVYSVGILLYELVCGQRLFSGLADFDALREVRLGRVRPSAKHVNDVEPELGEIIMKALHKDPDKRYASAGDFGSALRGYRYSLDTEITDPTAEIASLVQGHSSATELDESWDNSDDDFGRGSGSTVVRIDTAAEFNMTDLSGLHQLVTSFPEPKILGDSPVFDEDSLDDEKTIARAHPLIDVADSPTDSVADESAPDDALAATGVRPPRPRTVPGMNKPRSPKASFPSGALPRPKRAKAAAGPMPGVAPATESSIPDHYPSYTGKPAGFLAAEAAEAKRRKVRMGLIASALAIFVFVVAGHCLSGDGAESAAGVDAGASDAQDVDAVPAPKKKPPKKKIRKKKPRKKKAQGGKQRKGKNGKKKRRRP